MDIGKIEFSCIHCQNGVTHTHSTAEIAGTRAGLKAFDEETIQALRAKVAELEADAERYRLLRQKVCIISKGENAEFQIINLRPFYIAPCPDMELDAVLDAFLAQESK